MYHIVANTGNSYGYISAFKNFKKNTDTSLNNKVLLITGDIYTLENKILFSNNQESSF